MLNNVGASLSRIFSISNLIPLPSGNSSNKSPNKRCLASIKYNESITPLNHTGTKNRTA